FRPVRPDSLAPVNHYADFNSRLFGWMGNDELDRAQMDLFLTELSVLHQPQETYEKNQLSSSRLYQTIPNLVERIGRQAAESRPTVGDQQRFRQLWQQSVRLHLVNRFSLGTYMRTLLALCPKDVNTAGAGTVVAEAGDLVGDVWSSSSSLQDLFTESTWGFF